MSTFDMILRPLSETLGLSVCLGCLLRACLLWQIMNRAVPDRDLVRARPLAGSDMSLVLGALKVLDHLHASPSPSSPFFTGIYGSPIACRSAGAGLLQGYHLWWRALALLTGEHIARPVSPISTQISFSESRVSCLPPA